MERKFNKGAELDKQIYPEGESTWGCKSGVLDVEDVKESIKKINNYIKKECICYHCQKIIKVINNEVGNALATEKVTEDSR